MRAANAGDETELSFIGTRSTGMLLACGENSVNPTCVRTDGLPPTPYFRFLPAHFAKPSTAAGLATWNRVSRCGDDGAEPRGLGTGDPGCCILEDKLGGVPVARTGPLRVLC